jgi:Cu/Ag efflux protein CusF
MKRLIMSAASVAIMTGVAFAATDSGVIKHIDPKSDAITLDDGKTFTLAEGTEAESLKVGQKVEVTYDLKSGKMVATKILVVK